MHFSCQVGRQLRDHEKGKKRKMRVGMSSREKEWRENIFVGGRRHQWGEATPAPQGIHSKSLDRNYLFGLGFFLFFLVFLFAIWVLCTCAIQLREAYFVGTAAPCGGCAALAPFEPPSSSWPESSALPR